ncbi:hypothetical protein B0J13DRAFT_655982 [Dactylonectria estremocensis]|uniref:Uncharacterized protein n=1 Tax=Dactylonectria estremocensis TaxID=1079267 RepID=A0A9P9ICC8_9HYPO|nr:hypothetical protein B0J13DRAFT_655982 [Dactylonectria estremocensis]
MSAGAKNGLAEMLVPPCRSTPCPRGLHTVHSHMAPKMVRAGKHLTFNRRDRSGKRPAKGSLEELCWRDEAGEEGLLVGIISKMVDLKCVTMTWVETGRSPVAEPSAPLLTGTVKAVAHDFSGSEHHSNGSPVIHRDHQQFLCQPLQSSQEP